MNHYTRVTYPVTRDIPDRAARIEAGWAWFRAKVASGDDAKFNALLKEAMEEADVDLPDHIPERIVFGYFNLVSNQKDKYYPSREAIDWAKRNRLQGQYTVIDGMVLARQ